MISLSGPGPHLSMVSKSLESAPVKKFAHVHGWYHAGEQLQNAVEKVLRDVKRRDINFPSLKDLKRPIRSTNDGHLLNDRSLYNTTFAEWITRHLLIYPVDWITTSRRLSKNVMDFLEGDKTPKVEVSSFGPSTETIFTEIRAQLSHPRLIFSDRSPFKATENTNASVSTPGDIAIVGMGVNFPCGNNQSQLWETLSNGLNAVSEVKSRYAEGVLRPLLIFGWDRYQNLVSRFLSTTQQILVRRPEKCLSKREHFSRMYGVSIIRFLIYLHVKQSQWTPNSESSSAPLKPP